MKNKYLGSVGKYCNDITYEWKQKSNINLSPTHYIEIYSEYCHNLCYFHFTMTTVNMYIYFAVINFWPRGNDFWII